MFQNSLFLVFPFVDVVVSGMGGRIDYMLPVENIYINQLYIIFVKINIK